MRFETDYAGTVTEFYKGDDIIDLTVSIVVTDTFANESYIATVKIEKEGWTRITRTDIKIDKLQLERRVQKLEERLERLIISTMRKEE